MAETSDTVTSLDPVQGLIDFVNDVKPYHTKIVEVLVEYVYDEPTNASINETIKIDVTDYLDTVVETYYMMLRTDATTNCVVIMGDFASVFVTGVAFRIEGTTLATENGIYSSVSDAVYDPATNETTVCVVETFVNDTVGGWAVTGDGIVAIPPVVVVPPVVTLSNNTIGTQYPSGTNFGSHTPFAISVTGDYDTLLWEVLNVGDMNPPTTGFGGSGILHTLTNETTLNPTLTIDPSETTNYWVEVRLTATDSATMNTDSDTMVLEFFNVVVAPTFTCVNIDTFSDEGNWGFQINGDITGTFPGGPSIGNILQIKDQFGAILYTSTVGSGGIEYLAGPEQTLIPSTLDGFSNPFPGNQPFTVCVEV